jgi:hypothetical protein
LWPEARHLGAPDPGAPRAFGHRPRPPLCAPFPSAMLPADTWGSPGPG